MSEPTKIGRYEVDRLLGEGGIGRVYLAKDPVLGREVAIKVLRDRHSEHGSRVRNEARAAATVRHPNLVTLHDMGESDDVGLFLVFEYVQGPTLRERIASGPIPPIEVARIAMELGAALSTAHEAGIVHRDVKPENVICSATGAVLTDFGLALSESPMPARGTIAYAAPETLGADPQFSPRSDQFSLAATLYEALSGKRAFTGDDIGAVANAIQNDDPPPLATEETDYREKLMLTRAEGCFRRAFQKEPTLRYPSCRAFGDALGSAIDVRVSSGFPTISMHSASIVPRATRRWQNLFVLGALLVIAYLFLLGRKDDPHDNGAPLKSAADAFSSAIANPPHHVRHHATAQPSSTATDGGDE